MFGRKKLAMLVAEFLGTGVLTLVVLAVQHSQIALAYFVALAAGVTVYLLSHVFAADSGAHFNPAVTIGLWSARQVKTVAAALYIVAQLLGAWAAYGVYTYFVNTSLQPIGGHFTARILVAEAVGTFIFALTWAAVAARKLSASIAGAGFAVGMLIAAVASIGYINPAVALGSRAWEVMGPNQWGTWGTFALGPIIGGVVGFNLYQLVFNEGSLRLLPSRGASARAATVTTAKAPAKKRPAARKRK